MRMPNSRQISDEQEEIYLEAPTDGSIMVVGPPGTGKTVIAFLRAQMLERKKQAVMVLMYNKVLQKYTDNIEGTGSSTLHSWFYSWWRRNGIVTSSNADDKIYLNCPYEEKDDAKALGAKWDGNKRKWYVNKQTYELASDEFSRWEQEYAPVKKNLSPPMLSRFNFDWCTMLIAIAQKPVSNDWGHLIIDEAQDFPKEMFAFLRVASTQIENGGITILADENQRLKEEDNSTIAQIISSLAISDDRCYKLEENYRGTRQIAVLANCFYVGLPSGKPKLPNRLGDLPQLVKTHTMEEQIDYIVLMLSNRAPGEVGVILQNEKLRTQFFDTLKQRLGDEYEVQGYSSKEGNRVDELVFDRKGTVTVLNRQSCKGLEFDFVFVPELQNINTDGSHLDSFKMNMYVMCSRAREFLCLLYSSSDEEIPEIVKYLPPEETNILEYKNVE